MTGIATIEKAGVIPVQDFSFRTGRRKGKVDLGQRAVRYGVRIVDREDDQGQLGHFVVDPDVIGDFLDGVGWPASEPPRTEAGQIQRENGAWMGAWPAVLTSIPQPINPKATSSNPLLGPPTVYKARPLFEHPKIGLKSDLRFIELEVIPALPNLKKGTKGIVLNLTHEDKQVPVFMPINSDKLIAHWLNSPNDQSTTVFDIDRNGQPDPDRNARIDTTWQVREWTEPCQKAPVILPGKTGVKPRKPPALTSSASYGVAINAKRSEGGPGYFFATYPGMDALFSFLMNGPLRPATLLHQLADRPTDGPMVAGALDTNSYFTGGNQPFDGPLKFIEKPYPVVNDGVHPYEVFRHMEFKEMHGFRCRNLPGVWKEFVRLPVTETPPCTPTKMLDTTSSGDGNLAQRTYDRASNLVYMGKVQANGMIWQPRSGVLRGPPMASAALRSRAVKLSASETIITRRLTR